MVRSRGSTGSWDTFARSKKIRINGTDAPRVTGTAVTSSPDANSSYVTGDVIQVTATFNEAVTVDTASGTPSLALTVGSNTRYATYSASDSTATELVFAYTVTADDQDNDGISIAANTLELNGGAIHKQGDATVNALLGHGALSAQAGHRVNRAPFIVTDGVSVTSTPRAATDTYGAGEIIESSVTFSDAVHATTDTDFLLSVNGATRAPLLRGSGTATLVFGYTVQAGDTDTNGIWIGPSDRTREGARHGEPRTGTITSVATDLAADLTHGEVGTQSGHKVDGSLTPPDTNITPVIATTPPLETPENGTAVATLAVDPTATGTITDDDAPGCRRRWCGASRGTVPGWARSTSWTGARRSVLFDTPTNSETPVSWSAAEIGRGRR